MPVVVEWSKSALKKLGKLTSDEQQRVENEVKAFVAADPRCDVVSVEGQAELLRLRVGSWRVLLQQTDNGVRVEWILSRGEAYGARGLRR